MQICGLRTFHGIFFQNDLFFYYTNIDWTEYCKFNHLICTLCLLLCDLIYLYHIQYWKKTAVSTQIVMPNPLSELHYTVKRMWTHFSPYFYAQWGHFLMVYLCHGAKHLIIWKVDHYRPWKTQQINTSPFSEELFEPYWWKIFWLLKN